MKHLSLFSGIGGFDLAAQWMGWENVAHCEWNKFCQQILKYYWPQAISYEDITKTDFTIHRGQIDIVTGGFPCQPYSVAGKQQGKDDERHLWPHMLRAVREIKPRWVVGENVLGLVSWNDGLVFNEVQADLEAEGYEVQPFVLPAAGVGAPHQRQRVWFVGYAKHHGLHAAQSGGNDHQPSIKARTHQERKFEGTNCLQSSSIAHAYSHDAWRCGFAEIGQKKIECNCEENKRERFWPVVERALQKRNASNATSEGLQTSGQTHFGEFSTKSCTELDNRFEQFGNDVTANHDNEYANCKRCEKQHFPEKPTKSSRFCGFGLDETGDYWRNFPTQSPVCTGNDGISSRLDAITFSKWRNESIKGGGNAIVPQMALQIFKAIDLYEKSNPKI